MVTHRRSVGCGLLMALMLIAALIGSAAPVTAQAEVAATHDYTFGQRAISPFRCRRTPR